MLHPGDAVGDLGEVLPAQLLHPVEVEGAVVGADGVDLPGLQPRPQGRLVLRPPQGWGEDKFRALKTGKLIFSVVQQQVLGAGLCVHLLPPGAGHPDDVQPAFGGQVDDVHRVSRQLADGQPAVDGLRFHRRRVGEGVGGGAQVSCRPLSGNARRHQVAVLTVTAHDAAPLSHGPDHLQRRAVGHPQVVVSEIHLVGGHPGPVHVRQLLLDGGIPVLDGHVKAIVAGGDAVGPAVPHVQGRGQGGSPLRFGEVQHGGGAPRQRRQGAGGPAVRRLPGSALVHLKVGVGVDKAGEHQLARRVDHPAVPGGEAGADFRNFFPLHPQVGLDGTRRADQRAVLNQNGHENTSKARL